MKKIPLFFISLAAAITFAACQPAANTNSAVSNTNTNAAKPIAAAPTAEIFLDMDKKATEAYVRADGKYFDTLLSDKAVMSMGSDRMGKAAIVQMIGSVKCEGAEVKLSEPQMSRIDNDTYAFTYKNESTGRCSEGDGKMTEMKPMRASTVWVRNGEKWQAVWHSENPIMGAPAAADQKTTDKTAEPRKEASPAANSAAPAAPAKLTPSANTEALVKAHAAGWEAFRNKDAKYFDANLTSNFAFIDPAGGYTASKADAIKAWTETMKCEGITKTGFTDGFAVALSPTVEMLFGKGTADGTCDGRKNGDLWTTAVYVKEGDAWKLAYMFESSPM